MKIREALTEMNERLTDVEKSLHALNDEVQNSSRRQQALLAEMEQQSAAMRADAEAMRADAEAMRADAESMRKSSEGMRLEVSRNGAAFDQTAAGMADGVQKFRASVGIVVEFLVSRTADQDDRHAALERRVDALERKLAG